MTAPIDPVALMARLRSLPPEHRRAALEAAGEAAAMAFDEEWQVWVHDGQLPPHDDWLIWVIMGGRTFGKTRAGAEWVSAKARAYPDARIALVAANPDEARKTLVEGRSGLLAVARQAERRSMKWEPGLRCLTFASGALAFTYSGADGEDMRGPEHHFAWCDELAKWRRAETAWTNLMLSLRAGDRPQLVVTTTPRPVPAMRAVLATPGTVVTRGTSWDNPHVARAAVEAMARMHGGTRLERQELLGELVEDVQGSLWPHVLIERSRTAPAAREDLRRVVIGVDPPATADGDECGIVACGLGGDSVGRVLGDHSAGGLSPEQWASKVGGAAERWQADRIVAEGNQGGEMVEAVLRGAGIRLPVRRVHARFAKGRRAEPIAAFFESGEAKLAGRFPELEAQLNGLVTGGDYQGPGSPDRADAMVWAMTELLLTPQRAEPRIRAL
jgi:phage terminase large subunit-like protein